MFLCVTVFFSVTVHRRCSYRFFSRKLAVSDFFSRIKNAGITNINVFFYSPDVFMSTPMILIYCNIPPTVITVNALLASSRLRIAISQSLSLYLHSENQ